MTGRAWFIGTLICALIILGLLTTNGYVLLLTVPLLVYLAVGMLSTPEEIQVQVERTISTDRTAYGKPIQVKLRAENLGTTLEEVHLMDIVSPPLHLLEGQPGQSLLLPAGGHVDFEYEARGRRGEYLFEGVYVVATDPFGLFQIQRRLEVPDRVLIYPPIERLQRIEIRPQRTHGFAGPIPARKGGSGTDFFGVREYQLGDALRKINWRVTARHNEDLFTNEFEQESITDVGVILDAREHSHLHTPQGNLFEHSVRAAGSLAERFLQDSHRVGLLVYGHGIMRVFPGYGAVQRERILNALARAQTGTNYVFESLNHLPTRFFPPRSQLVIVSPLLPDDLPGLLRFRAQGYAILVVSPNPVDFEVRSLPATAGLEASIRLARIERTLLLGQLKRAGIRVVDWPVDRPLDQVLHTTLARQPVQRPPIAVLR